MGSALSTNNNKALFLGAPWAVKGQATAPSTAPSTVPLTTPKSVPITHIVDISRNPTDDVITFDLSQLQTFVEPDGITGTATSVTENRFRTSLSSMTSFMGLRANGNFIQYQIPGERSNADLSCLNTSVDTSPVTTNGLPIFITGQTFIQVPRDGSGPASSIEGTFTVSGTSINDVGLNECTVCIFEYDTNDDGTFDESDAAIVWNVGSNDGSTCITPVPSNSPSESSAPSFLPSDSPSTSSAPSSMPSDSPSTSSAPSDQPSTNPSASSAPSDQPSNSPSESQAPSDQPSTNPSASSAPSDQPSNSPSESQAPSDQPSNSPSESQAPSDQPSNIPSTSLAPSNQPTFCLKTSKTKSPGKGRNSPGKGTKSPGKGGGMMMTKSPVQTCFETAFPTNSPGKGKRDI